MSVIGDNKSEQMREREYDRKGEALRGAEYDRARVREGEGGEWEGEIMKIKWEKEGKRLREKERDGEGERGRENDR